MTIFIAGYVILSIILLLLVNFLLKRRGKKNLLINNEEKETETVHTESTVAESTITNQTAENEQLYSTTEEKEEVVQLSKEENLDAEKAIVSEEEKLEAEKAIQMSKEAELEHEVAPETVKKHHASDDIPFSRGKIIIAIMLGAFVAILNQTLLNVAIPHIMNDLNVSANTVQWLSTGYMLVNGILIPITAFMITKWGTRNMLISAVSLFTIGSILCAISTNFSILMVGRVVQAAGAGIIMPLLMTVMLTIFPPEKRGAAMGLMGVAMIFAPAVGPTLSGWLIGHYNWHVLFDLIIPFGIVDLIFALIWMKDVTKRTNPKMDLPGIIFSTIGFGFLLYGFSEAGNDGWDSKTVIISLIIGIAALVAFVIREVTTKEPMLNLSVFKYDIFALTTIISMAINMAMFAAMILLPIYLQNIRGFSALDSGLLMLPGAIVMGIMSPISGWLFDRIGARWLAVVGLIITVITTYQFTHLSMSTTYPHLMLLYVLRMFGMSFIMMTVMTEGMNQLPLHLTSHGTAASNTARTVAGSIGTAFLVTVMTNRASFHTANYADVVSSANPYIANKFAQLSQGFAQLTGGSTQTGQALTNYVLYGKVSQQATIEGINDAFLVATGIAVVALILAFFIRRARPNKIKE
ncbi:DHA2 family efflux MFS transporter permease subunit [Heyndrickxia ginsengihumi]